MVFAKSRRFACLMAVFELNHKPNKHHNPHDSNHPCQYRGEYGKCRQPNGGASLCQSDDRVGDTGGRGG
ncbi:Uncharacterised protein [Moraxella bovis]|uniref:Uncharacterized protein n=1 Tax=Moraxella bovis TaxID=476 RepID=A0A378PRV0_MORBO|nr:Uncharacterised protein [Moraxella bovis]